MSITLRCQLTVPSRVGLILVTFLGDGFLLHLALSYLIGAKNSCSHISRIINSQNYFKIMYVYTLLYIGAAYELCIT